MEMDQKSKNFMFLDKFHSENSNYYSKIRTNLFEAENATDIEQLPYLPSSLFKTIDLISISEHDIFKTLYSSGTSGQARSKIFLDRKNALNQTKALVSIMSDKFGNSRVPMLILDSKSQTNDRATFSARGAGILGFSIFASKKFFALNEAMEIDETKIKEFIQCDNKNPKLLYGFTSIIWEEILEKLSNDCNILSNQKCILIHGGGWKKLSDQKITTRQFNDAVKYKLGPNVEIHEYYGMVEQTGSVFLGCEEGYLHTNEFNDIIIRDPETLTVKKNGEIGVIQSLSSIATSYPGFSILTEDLGVVYGNGECNQKCLCGNKSKFFSVLGRLPKSELRGCSNTYGA